MFFFTSYQTKNIYLQDIKTCYLQNYFSIVFDIFGTFFLAFLIF